MLYANLLSRQYAGDGLRHLTNITGIWSPELGGTNHLLFPLIGWLWYHIIGIHLPISTLQSVQLMNAFFAALAIVLYAQIVTTLGAGAFETCLATFCLIFANAYWSNAVDMLEVMPSIPFMYLAILVVLVKENTWRYVSAGVLFAVSTSIYQASIFSLLVLVAIAWWNSSQKYRNLVIVTGSYLLSVGLIYLIAFRTLGDTNSWPEAFQASLVTESPQAFGYFDPRHFVGALFGWVAVWISLFNFQGVNLLLQQKFSFNSLINLSLVTLQYGLYGIVAIPIIKNWRRLSNKNYSTLKIMLSWFIPPFLFLVYWLPAYGKLWIPPLSATISIFAILLTLTRQTSSRIATITSVSAILLCGLTIILNLFFGLLPTRFSPNIHLNNIIQISQQISENDLVISDGWGVSATYLQHFTNKRWLGYAGLALAIPNKDNYNVIGKDIVESGDNEAVEKYLSKRIAMEQSQGNDIYFLGLLDLNEKDWQPLFKERFNMDYQQLELYRIKATPVATLSETTLTGQPLHLWKLSN